jgi:GNAT superfamily N-acetyltransferase
MVKLAEGAGHCYDLFVEPAYRGKGVAGAGVDYRLSVMRQQGFQQVSVATNRASRTIWNRRGIPSWDSLQIILGGRSFWLMGKPWPRLGVATARGDAGPGR